MSKVYGLPCYNWTWLMADFRKQLSTMHIAVGINRVYAVIDAHLKTQFGRKAPKIWY